MSELHVATSSPFVKALVETCVQFVKDFTPIMHDGDPQQTLYDLWTEMDDHLQVPLSVVVAEWELSYD